MLRMNATFKGEVNSSKGQGINTLNQVNTDELLESKAPSSAAIILMPAIAKQMRIKSMQQAIRNKNVMVMMAINSQVPSLQPQ